MPDTTILKGLNHRQDLFVRHYLALLDATAACKAAGYSQRSAKQHGYNLLRTHRVRAAIEAELKKRREKATADEAFIVDALREVVERCLQRVPVLDRKGRRSGVWKFDATGAARALELLGRHKGMFTDNLRLGDPLDDLTDDQLDDRLDQLTGRLESRRKARTPPAAH